MLREQGRLRGWEWAPGLYGPKFMYLQRGTLRMLVLCFAFDFFTTCQQDANIHSPKVTQELPPSNPYLGHERRRKVDEAERQKERLRSISWSPPENVNE